MNEPHISTVSDKLEAIWDEHTKKVDKDGVLRLNVRGSWRRATRGYLHIRKVDGNWAVMHTPKAKQTRKGATNPISVGFNVETGDTVPGSVNVKPIIERGKQAVWLPVEDGKEAGEIMDVMVGHVNRLYLV